MSSIESLQAELISVYIQSNSNTTICARQILTQALQIGGIPKGFIAARQSYRDEGFTVIHLVDSVPLAFPDLREHDSISYPFVLDSVHCRYHHLVYIELKHETQLKGVVGLCYNPVLFEREQTFIHHIHSFLQVGASVLAGCMKGQTLTHAHEMFLATMSHEIRTPLNGVIGLSRLLLGDKTLTADQNYQIDMIYKCGYQLVEIVNDIMDYARMHAGQVTLQATSFDLRHAVESSIEIIYVKAHEKGLRLECDIDAGCLETIVGDCKRLKQVLINLLNNAVKFTEQGLIQVRVNTVLAVPTRPLWPYDLIIEVKDEGMGIPPEYHEKVFDDFLQVKQSVLSGTGGVGLGLSICKQLIRLMGGDIRVKDSKVGQGTCMSFSVPTRAGDPSLCSAHITKTVSGKNALVVLSPLAQRLHLCDLLLKLSMNPFGCATAAEAQLYMDRAFRLDLAFVEVSSATGWEQTLLKASIPVIWVGQKPDTAKPSYGLSEVEEGCLKRVLQQIYTRPATPSPTAKSGQILVVEDNKYNMETIVRMLRRLGYKESQIHCAYNGLQAVEMCQQQTYDIILMDLKMPVMDGYQAATEILKTAKPPPCLIALTAFVSDEERERCEKAGFAGFLRKPLLQESLEAALDVVSAKPQKTKTVRVRSRSRERK